MLLADAARDRYFADRPEIAPGTRQNVHATLRTFDAFLSRPATLTDLTKPTIAAFMLYCAETLGLAPKTINNKRGDLLTLWYCFAEADLLPPPPRIRKRKEPKRLPVVWTLEEVRRLYATAGSVSGHFHGLPKSLILQAAISLLWDTGERIGALRKAKLPHVNLAARTWFVPAENRKGKTEDRIYRLHPDSVKLLLMLLTARRDKLLPLPGDKNTLYGWLRNLLRLADLPGDRAHKFHCIRRTAETHAAAEKGISWAAQAIGHTEAVARKYYIHPEYIATPALIDAIPRLARSH